MVITTATVPGSAGRGRRPARPRVCTTHPSRPWRPASRGSASTSSSGSASAGRSRPAAIARSAVRRASARYGGTDSGATAASRSRCRATVPASPRETGPVSAASPSRSALSSAARSSGASTCSGLHDTGVAQPVERLVDERDQVVRAVGERRVVERAVGLGDPLRRRRRGRRPAASANGRRSAGAVTPKEMPRQPVQVGGRAGEGHRRVQRQRPGAERGRRRQHGQPVRAGGVRDDLAGAQRARRGEAGDHRGRARRRGRRAAADRWRRGRPRRRAGRAAPGSRRAMRSRAAAETPEAATTRWPAAGERGAENGTDPAGADHADESAGGTRAGARVRAAHGALMCRSSPRSRGTGRRQVCADAHPPRDKQV